MLDVLCVLFLTAVAVMKAAVVDVPHTLDDKVFEKLMTSFRRRGIDDWASRWKTEKHRRCTMQLHRHMLLVCRVHDTAHAVKKWSDNPPDVDETSSRLSPTQTVEESQEADLIPQDESKEIERPYELVRKRRSLTEQCCYSDDGCTWADYAEYCDTPFHRVHPLLS